jgi:hypothetical protein
VAVTIEVYKYNAVCRRILCALLLLLLAAVIAFSCMYLSYNHSRLADGFMRLNDCFYRSGNWRSDFFTPQVKAAGNKYCVAAVVIAVAGIWYVMRRFKQQQLSTNRIAIDGWDLLCAGICIMAGIGLWLWGSPMVQPSNDEVFSAVNCAALHPFQTASYYMLPNNHVLFNLLNNVFFHGFGDKVVSGRIISLLCYLVLLPLLYYWLRSLITSGWLALLATLTMAVQFPVWGFSLQARGYELLTLLTWVAFIVLFNYWRSSQRHWLYILSIACAAAYWTVPTFLYFHAALLAFAFFYQLSGKRIDLIFWKYQLFTVLLVYLLYLPCFCLSGLDKITANPWVALPGSYSELLSGATGTFKEYMDHCFCNPVTGHYAVDLVLFFSPLTLMLYRKNKTACMLGGFYLCTWCMSLLIAIVMKVLPLDRSLSAQFSITLGLVIYTIYLWLQSLKEKVGVQLLPAFVVPLLLALLTLNYIKKDQLHVTHYLCHFPVNTWYKTMTDGISKYIPGGSTVGFSDESFFCYYLCKRNNYAVSKCATGTENYLIKRYDEPLLPEMQAHYERTGDIEGYFDIYKRK